MRLAYLTIDEVNEALALEMARACGVHLDPLAPKDPPPDGEYDAVLIDWDHWPLEVRDKLLTRLRAGPQGHAVAVHSYHLADDQAEVLRGRGVAVHGRLEPEVLRLLCEAVATAEAAEAPALRPDSSTYREKVSGTFSAISTPRRPAKSSTQTGPLENRPW